MRALLGIRAWLALTLVLVSVLTAGTIALYVIPAANGQVLGLAQDAALGLTARAARDVGAESPGDTQRALASASREGQMSLWLVDSAGRQVAASALPSVQLSKLPDTAAAIRVALSGRRYVPSASEASSHVVALPAVAPDGTRLALVAYAPRAAFADRTSAALQHRFLLGVLFAIGLAIVLSLLVATVLTRRVRRLAHAASEIAGGEFHRPLRDGFPDEIGQLARSVDEMRERLAASFAVLEHQRGGLSRVLDGLEEGVVALDPLGVVEVVNPAASELLGIPVEQGSRLLQPWPASLLDEPVGTTAGTDGDIETPTGRFVRVQRTLLRRDDDHGGRLLVISDRSAARRREEAERRFVANASHELRTPLSAILAAVEMLQTGAKEDIAQRDAFLADVQHESERLERLTDRLLTIARIDDGSLRVQLQPVPVAGRLTYVAGLLTPLAQAGGVALSVSGDGTALADPDMLDQVLIGLVGNAVKYTPRGGRVELDATTRGEQVVIRVVDSGCGIDAVQLPRVFDRFWRGDGARRAGGFGLGLGICQEYVVAMDGEIEIRSRPGAGTTAVISLPLPVRAGVAV